MDTKIEASNSLADLAARIKAEHEAAATALKDSVAHAIEAGALLLEAKDQIPHGGWLPWLRDHCTISERTAQLYMRVAKNRAVIEEQIRNDVADLSLNEAAALLMLTSDVRKVLSFARECEHLSGDELVERCIAEGVGVIVDRNYDPFAGRNEAEVLEWNLFAIFLTHDPDGTSGFMSPQGACDHIEYLLQRPFQNVTEWLGEEGDRFRKFWGGKTVSEQFKADWALFRAARRNLTLDDVNKEFKNLGQRFEQALAEGRIHERPTKRGIRSRMRARA